VDLSVKMNERLPDMTPYRMSVDVIKMDERLPDMTPYRMSIDVSVLTT
jgi:hypothetical protein